MKNNNKRSASALRVARSKERYRKAGLVEIKVWTHPHEADDVRKYAAKKPLTKAIRKELRNNV